MATAKRVAIPAYFHNKLLLYLFIHSNTHR
jgi:hypothetical protein